MSCSLKLYSSTYLWYLNKPTLLAPHRAKQYGDSDVIKPNIFLCIALIILHITFFGILDRMQHCVSPVLRTERRWRPERRRLPSTLVKEHLCVAQAGWVPIASLSFIICSNRYLSVLYVFILSI